MNVSDVFGINSEVRLESYVDRGDLDTAIGKLLVRNTHIALKGESKCGKSWLRQKNLPNAIVVQCRLGRGAIDIYVDALSQLGVSFVVSDTTTGKIEGRVEATGAVGEGLLSKVFGLTGSASASAGASRESIQGKGVVGRDINDLRYVAELIRESRRHLVVEDFHYLSVEERRKLAFDLKALWDYGLYVVIIGVWSQSNLLIYLNPDLTGRIEEVSVYWSTDDLKGVLDTGGAALNLRFNAEFADELANLSYGNAGILQTLTIRALDALEIVTAPRTSVEIADKEAIQTAALHYADQLNALYQQFAKRVARGVRTRKDSTGIYAHAMAVIMDASDELSIRGIPLDYIFRIANEREPRIQKGNLRTILEKLEGLQVDEAGRGLVVAYNEADGEVSIVDRQVLLYRRFSTVSWPWEELIEEAGFDS
ncbi:hypothetical protein CKO31_18180 [Thiohalocapsa halophila]|uniref:ATP-binding protein n=1 Tax=Thiohalocapsa halophila TaxID=69359 RepID=A0ABS1CMB8_9GAMM|nr:hypothetical protein [Thiohalocapsa halophila]MBK1632634.1 hypothetical protein [Thiohalocapsa halophila]